MKKMIALLLALVMAFALVACGGQENNQTSGNEEGSDKILIGAIYRDLTQTWFEKESTAAKATADELGIDILIGDGQEDPAVLIAVLDSFITLGIRGLVIDGTCRDADDIQALGFPVFSRGFNPGGTVKETVGQTEIPLVCGGVPVRPGDLVVGNRDGVVVVAKENIEAVQEGPEGGPGPGGTEAGQDHRRDLQIL